MRPVVNNRSGYAKNDPGSFPFLCIGGIDSWDGIDKQNRKTLEGELPNSTQLEDAPETRSLGLFWNGVVYSQHYSAPHLSVDKFPKQSFANLIERKSL
jgi:hypothetical protein